MPGRHITRRGPSTKPIIRLNSEGKIVELRRGHRRIVFENNGWRATHKPYGATSFMSTGKSYWAERPDAFKYFALWVMQAHTNIWWNSPEYKEIEKIINFWNSFAIHPREQ